MKTTASVTGLAELDAALLELESKTTSRNVLKRTLKKVLTPVYDSIVANAPEHIKDSVEISDKLTKRQASFAKKMGKAGIELFVGVTYHLGMRGRTAHLFEFGTTQRTRKSDGASTGSISPQPFIRPAWDENKDGLLDALKAELWIDIKKTADRIAKKRARKAKAGGSVGG
jgi:HK97 gp10 family phage protein